MCWVEFQPLHFVYRLWKSFWQCTQRHTMEDYETLWYSRKDHRSGQMYVFQQRVCSSRRYRNIWMVYHQVGSEARMRHVRFSVPPSNWLDNAKDYLQQQHRHQMELYIKARRSRLRGWHSPPIKHKRPDAEKEQSAEHLCKINWSEDKCCKN